MDFRLMGLDGYDHHGSSTFIKQERSDPFDKRVDDLGPIDHSKPPQQMLSFSTTNQPDFVSFFSTKYGYGSGNMSGGMHGSFGGFRGTFTPAQWIELEHQAMVYKYITANVPVPSNLLIPIKKAIQSAAFPGFSIGSYPSPSYGWGAFHLGFSGNSDPEPGRCRRTDGKKWRCSRDAVPDQKYCERHINRGRHRSRKPVEGHTGQVTPGAVTTKMVPPSSSLVPSGGDVPKGALITQHQPKASRPAGATNTSTRPVAQSHNDQQGLSMMPQTVNLESNDSQYSIPKQHISFDESSVSDFGIVSNDALLNPSQKSSYMDCKSYDTLLEFNSRQNQEQYHLQQFTEDWPKDQAGHRVVIPWLKDPKSDWTQLSMSIPLSNEFSSSSCSPIQDLEQARQMGLGVGTIVANVGSGTKQNEWIPITSRNSMGGPLGEVLLNNGSPPHSTV